MINERNGQGKHKSEKISGIYSKIAYALDRRWMRQEKETQNFL